MVCANVFLMDDYLPAIMSVIYTDTLPADAIKLVEQEDET
jgi:hypothetical protein